MVVIPRLAGRLPGDVTDFHPGQATWSRYNMPDIIYMFEPPDEWIRYRNEPRPDPKKNPDGTEMVEKWPDNPENPNILLDFKILPDQVRSS